MTRHDVAHSAETCAPGGPPAGPQRRPLRADAARNRARVLDAARAAFAAEGPSVPLDEIARRAGVGAGTVYRHFPTKEVLFEAVVCDRLTALADEADAALAAPDAGPAFFGFFHAMVSDAASKADLAEALIASGHSLQPETLDVAARLRTGLNALLTRAQQAGEVRADLAVEDLHALVVGALAAQRHAVDQGTPADGRLTGFIADGLRPRG